MSNENINIATHFFSWVNLLGVVGTWKVPESIEQQQIIKWLFLPMTSYERPII